MISLQKYVGTFHYIIDDTILMGKDTTSAEYRQTPKKLCFLKKSDHPTSLGILILIYRIHNHLFEQMIIDSVN